ncbi:hypothetical protein G6O67_004492 [Ophiocordyceps sinensis]|uniref:Fucose-specific lectin n=1 Tax=Ophiocordyceps sinensis TaxID=72228 RepID=A0A8H4PPI7_9HYPO|nr:hypothetical protein G6O67_004492 [Ophiocordyceps sinensis]
MPLDIPWLLRREQGMTHGVEPGTWAPSSTPNGGGDTSLPQVPETIHNHYYAADRTAIPWYRRRKFHFWLAVLVLVVIVIASAVVLGVVLKSELGKRRAQNFKAETGGAGAPWASLTRDKTPPLTSTSSSLSKLQTSTMSSSSATSSSTSSASSSVSVSTESAPRLNETVVGIVSSFLATLTDHGWPSSSSSWSSTSSSASSSSSTSTLSPWSSSSTSPWSSSSTSTSALPVETAAEIFTLSESSQLASAYFKSDTPELHRRVLVWQDDKSDLIATEWFTGRRTQYRIRDQAESRLPEAKLGTPLAVTTSSSGVVHVFFLDTQGALSHIFEETKGQWKRGLVAKNNGPIVASSSSPLSAVWHRASVGRELLGVAYANAQKLRLALNDKPDQDGAWQVLEAASLPDPVPGMTERPLFSVAGEWGSPSNKMLMAVLVDEGLFAWECSLDLSSPSKTKSPCRLLNDTFQGMPLPLFVTQEIELADTGKDERGRELGFAPPPRQLGWISLAGTNTDYDFSLVGLDADGRFVDENHVKAGGKGRRAGRGLETKMTARAIATTDEGILFAAAGDDVYIYKLDTEDWTWRAQGSLMPARG